MEKLYKTDSFKTLISKFKESLFDVFIDSDKEDIYFTDGLDIGIIYRDEENNLVLSLVLKDNKYLVYKRLSHKEDSYPIFLLEDVINRNSYKGISINKESFFTGATEWLKQNRKLKKIGGY